MSGGHETFKHQLPSYLLGSLDRADRLDLEHHLEGCSECRAELEWLEPAVDVLAADVEQVEPSPGLKRRVMAAVEADLAAGPASGAAAEPGPEPSEVAARPARRRSWSSGLLRPAVVGAVAVALFAGLVAGHALDRDGSDDSPSRRVITGESTNGADAVMVASGGTGTLKVTNLGKPDEGQVYQAWIQRGQEVEPTDSLFLPRRDGTAVASIPDIEGVDAVMVSSEPDGGSKQPTTAPVITVTMPG